MRCLILDVLGATYSNRTLRNYGYGKISNLISKHLKSKHSIEFTISAISYSIRKWLEANND